MIIDEELDYCRLLKRYFKKRQYSIYIAHNINDGTRLIAAKQPDVLFLDNQLPDGSGWLLGPEIAANYPKTFIVLNSALPVAIPAMPATANYQVLSKPVSLAALENLFGK